MDGYLPGRFDRSRLGDRAEIGALVAEFAHLIDRGSPSRVAELFAPDGWYGREDGARSVGRVAIRAAYARRAAEHPTRVSRHIFSNLRIAFDGADRATGMSILTLVAGDGSPPLPLTFSLIQDYLDTYVLIDGVWLFGSRQTRRVFVGTGFREALHLGGPT